MKLRSTYDCIILVMKLLALNSFLVVRVERESGGFLEDLPQKSMALKLKLK